MNIWWVNHVALPPTEAGVTRHYDFARELINRGHGVTVMLSNFHYIRRREIRDLGSDSTRLELIEGVPFLWVRTPHYGARYVARVWSWLVLAWRLWREQGLADLDAPDVIIGSSPYPFAALAAQRLARRRGIPFVLEIRDLWPQTLIELGRVSRWHPFIALLGWLERFLYRNADAIVSLLPHAAEYMVQKGANPRRITWIPNGVDLDGVPASDPPPSGDPFRVFYAGGHGLPNELDDLLDAAAILQTDDRSGRIKIHLVGDGPEKKRLMRRADEECLDNVVFEDPVPKRQVHSMLQRADAFAVIVRSSPLYRYGVSLNKFFDYLAAGRPTAVASTIEPNPFEEAGAGELALPGDPESLARAIIRLASLSWDERRKMGRAGRDYVRRNHDLPELVTRLEAVLRDLDEEPV
ncbi:MAG: glycosyltransferase family 4 protein [Gemmatimonadota bacterium]